MLEPNVIEERTNSRTSVVLRALLLTPTAIVLLVLLAISISYLPSSFIAVTILALGGIPAAIEAIAAIRDLRATPIETRGTVSRLWTKARYLFVGRVDYMLVGRRLFEVGAIARTELQAGDEVIIQHWPHTHVVISLARVPAPPAPPRTRSSSSDQR